MPVQNVNGSVPITNIQPPPEGTMAASVNVTLTAAEPMAAQTFQLSSQNGLMLSQVVALVIDNSANAYPLTVTHGALAETTQVAAATVVIVQTFSSRAGGFPLQVAAVGNIVPTATLDIDIIFLNYPRQPGTFSATAQSTIIATGQNTESLYSGVLIPTATGLYPLVAAGNYILDSLDMAVEGFFPTAAGLVAITYSLIVPGTQIHSGEMVFTAAAGGSWTSGANVNAPTYRTWPQGLLLSRGQILNLWITQFVNCTSSLFRINISGVSTP